MSRRKPGCDHFLWSVNAMIALGLISSSFAGDPPPLPDWKENAIHDYADAAACEMGAGPEHYIPNSKSLNITPDSGIEIPIFWNKKRVTWSNKFGEFLFDGKSGTQNPPEGAASRIRYTDPNGKNPLLKCDAFARGPSNPCIPGQKLWNKRLPDGTIWMAILRRSCAVTLTKDWGPCNKDYFDVVDVNAFKPDTYATAWFDTLNTNASKEPNYGFPAGAVPRPGGLRPQLRSEGVRASNYYDPPLATDCSNCHSNAHLGTEWLAQIDSIDFNDDSAKPMWFAGVAARPTESDLGTLNPLLIKKAVSGVTYKGQNRGQSCLSCHATFLAGSMASPGGGEIADKMTSLNDQRDFPVVSGWRTDSSQSVVSKKDARKTHAMPKNHGEVTIQTWEDAYEEDYNLIACCTSDSKKPICKDVQCQYMAAVHPKFYTDQDKNPPRQLAQKVGAPKDPINLNLAFVPCPPNTSGLKKGDQCWQMSWEDNQDPFNTPRKYSVSVSTRSALDPDWTDAELASSQFCKNGDHDYQGAQITGQDPKNPWRYRYTKTGVLSACSKMTARLCGSWCDMNLATDQFPNAGSAQATSSGLNVNLSNTQGCALTHCPPSLPQQVSYSTMTYRCSTDSKPQKNGSCGETIPNSFVPYSCSQITQGIMKLGFTPIESGESNPSNCLRYFGCKLPNIVPDSTHVCPKGYLRRWDWTAIDPSAGPDFAVGGSLTSVFQSNCQDSAWKGIAVQNPSTHIYSCCLP